MTEEKPVLNKKLLQEIMDLVNDLPVVPKKARNDRSLFQKIKGYFWFQGTWGQQTQNGCGTACCFAGWTVLNQYKSAEKNIVVDF